jgi:hypothetical protein
MPWDSQHSFIHAACPPPPETRRKRGRVAQAIMKLWVCVCVSLTTPHPHSHFVWHSFIHCCSFVRDAECSSFFSSPLFRRAQRPPADSDQTRPDGTDKQLCVCFHFHGAFFWGGGMDSNYIHPLLLLMIDHSFHYPLYSFATYLKFKCRLFPPPQNYMPIHVQQLFCFASSNQNT